MKRVFVNEDWCLGCHLCEYNCAYANSGLSDMVKALKGKDIFPRIHIEETDGITYAVSCRHCKDPLCVKSCIAGAISIEDGTVKIDKTKCVGCLTCVLVCPYGAVAAGPEGAAQKCELCLANSCGSPACVKGCPNNAIVYEER
ncbi:MAG: 4Fe-4S binding protein [Ruminococcus sp.]|jgi:carbon-monoxide dehydrogenase iron sulfur subunit|uniref:4Fe-4S ferredoxin n=1 Tax=Ruminococcus albus SY3 TaxID=1341156 RepID=A0A011WKG7_RUMAL|nr:MULTISPECIES: 4Fe-4S dicluster domain-containing protein [Ruminococcus]EXM37495.1 4Fe-4S ferredoxin [Ruminococcus albus SY3]MBE6869279.1 4Fe-4S ferredoxin [Ruminococcus albus]MCR5539587.1 4Fe-4S binding protein [Ruminococcus sp.]